jgi:uncharacterized membrane protein required for colicin V production
VAALSLVLDGFFLLVILIIAFMGFSMGLVKIGTAILGMYLGVQIAAIFYTTFASLTTTPGSSSSKATNEIVWFFALWVVWSVIFTLIVWSFSKTLIVPKRLANLDQLGGLVLGMFAGIFGLFVLAFVFKNTVYLIWFGSGRPNNWIKSILDGFDTSVIFNILRSIRFVYLNILSPWLPVNQMPIFKDNPLLG